MVVVECAAVGLITRAAWRQRKRLTNASNRCKIDVKQIGGVT